MSDGNHMQRGILPLLAIAFCFAGSGGLALANGAEDSAGTIGIVTANVAWESPTDARATFAEIAGAGFSSVRIGLKNPVTSTYAALAAANEAGLRILITFPLVDGSVSIAGTPPRAATKRFFNAFGLSQIDLLRFERRVDDLLDFVESNRIPLLGLELGNEINWSGYNGDLPLRQTGEVIFDRAAFAPDVAARFDAGMVRYRQVLEIARASLAARPTLANVKLLSAGLADINSAFIRQSGATYIAPTLVYDDYVRQHVFALTDAVGIHLYEPLRRASQKIARPGMIETQLADCGQQAFANRPCWITEFGSALPETDCAIEDDGRIALVRPLLDYLAAPDRAQRVPYAFYYDWDADKSFALNRCGSPTALVDALSGANGDNRQH